MKYICSLLFLTCFAGFGFSQVPDLINYQAVIRNDKGAPIVNQDVGIKVSILSKSANGNTVFEETHKVKSNSFGVINMEIGSGNNQNGDLGKVKWHSDDHYVKLEADAAGGTNYVLFGTQKLLTVPYAFQAQKATRISGINTIDTNHTNEIQKLAFDGDSLRISQGNAVLLRHSKLVDADGDTKIDLEEKADEDVVRVDAAGTEVVSISEKEMKVYTGLTVENSMVVIDSKTNGSSALLDMQSTNKGVLVPRLTDTEVANIATPVDGLLVYNETKKAFQYYNGSAWSTMVSDQATDLRRLKTFIHLESGL